MNFKYSAGLLFFFLTIVYFDCVSQTLKSEKDFKKYFTEHAATLDTIEGLWSVNTKQEFYNYDTLYDEKSFTQTVAVMANDSLFFTYDMKGGQYTVFFSKTEVSKVYLYKILLNEIDRYTKTDAVISANRTMQYKYEFPEEYLHLIFKNSFEQGDRVVNIVTWNKVYPK